MTSDDTFELYDLEVTVEGDEKDFVCRHHAGHAFRVEGEDLVFPEGGRFSMYALAALIPLLPAKERPTSPVPIPTAEQSSESDGPQNASSRTPNAPSCRWAKRPERSGNRTTRST